jgi:DNA-binding transcriptional LysR family regulator
MAFTETKTIDQITVTENGIVLYREATRILKDGDQIAQTYHRTSLTPGQDLTGQPDNVKAIAQVTWTEAVIAAYQEQISQQVI